MRQAIADLERLIASHARTMADAMLAAAKSAGSEEDVRHECNKLIDEFISLSGLQVKGRHEYAIGGGRLDSKYQGVLLEYKHPKGPHKITEDAGAPGAKNVVAQIKQRIADFERDEGYRPERLLGVGCDGDTILFVRYRSGKWEVEDPKPVTRHTVERLLRALVSLGAQGHSFTPERLAEDFGADASLPVAAIAALYRAITQTRSRKAKMFFNQWKLLFGEVCGYDVEGKNPKVAKLASHYHLAGGEPAPILFAVHSYYAILMKFLAAEIAGSFSPLGTSVLKKCAAAATNAQLRREVAQLEQGGIWTQLGITNFLEGDLFSWYLAAWSEQVAEAVRSIARALDGYDPATLSVEPTESRDLLKKLYQHLFPKSVRHDLGEYYTPDWLAEHVLNELGYDGDPDKRILDPACGSGTFLVMAINRVKQWFEQHAHECGFGEKELMAKVQSNVIGFDLNPLAVMAARTNYLLAVRDLLRFAPRLEIPVYLCDSVMTPAEHGELFTGKGARKLRTAAGEFIIPGEIATDRERVAQYADTLEFCIRNKYPVGDFLARCEEEGIPVAERQLHTELYEQLRVLDAEDQNGIWARIIKNAFAPLFVGRVHFVAGNPPWIRWAYLPGEYRDKSKWLWHQYGLFSLKGHEARLGPGEKDFSQLFTYACLDSYLRTQGRLGFVITQSVFRSKGQASGFRRFRLGDREHFRIARVDDFSRVKAFEAANLACTFLAVKGEETVYPVPYYEWTRPAGTRIQPDEELGHVLAKLGRRTREAAPLTEDPSSHWQIVDPCTRVAVGKVQGKAGYTAHQGGRTDPYGVYWVQVLQEAPKGCLLVRNMGEAGKTDVDCVTAAIERTHVYPAVKGRNVRRWQIVNPFHIIMVQEPDRRLGIPEGMLRRKAPRTYALLMNFRSILLDVASKVVAGLRTNGPFYSMYGIGPYTMSEWKVVWPMMTNAFRASVVSTMPVCGGPDRPVIPCTNTITFVAAQNAQEAHYICGALNSAPSRFFIAGSSAAGRGFGTPAILKSIALAKFDSAKPVHRLLSETSRQCHEAALHSDLDSLGVLEQRIDEAAAEMWGITAAELETIQAALRET
ncbi:MAG TPA: N-6 DNA methylase [Planctomycetota bacterium]|nr:N-6 DNA methylase [Planctomycetota bacterium]